MNRSRSYFVICCLTVSGSLGCGGAGSDLPVLAPVTGQLMQDGKPLAGAQILFVPEVGGPSSAVTDDDGKFELQYSHEEMGAAVGRHKVTAIIYGERGPSEVEGDLGPSLEPPEEFDLGSHDVPEAGLDDLTMEIPTGASSVSGPR